MKDEEAALNRITRQIRIGYVLIVVSFVIGLANGVAFVATRNPLSALLTVVVGVCVWVQTRMIHKLQDAAADLRFVLDNDLQQWGGG